MPRRLLRDGLVIDDDWQYLIETEDQDSPALIVPFDHWLKERDSLIARGGRLGIVLTPVHKVEQLAADLARFSLIGVEFPSISEGRGYTQARLLRERYHFTGELRATGYVRRDQLFFLARCGFNSFELPDSEFDAAGAAFATFSATYQPSNDAGLTARLRHR
jgi:uncharacterized protein (DUF934 family)